jgi:hypothetical protein
MKVMRLEAVTLVVLQIQVCGMLLSFAGKYLPKSLFLTLKMKVL